MKLFESFFIVLTFALASITGYQFSNLLPKPLPQYIFSQSDDYQSQIEQATLTAAQQNKKLMIVLGAEWCYDSRMLAANFSTAKMQEILQRDYETVFVDVGFFENYHHIAQAYDYPAYFGTPTVFVVDPKTNRLLNRTSVVKWQSSAYLSQSEFIESFSALSSTVVPNTDAYKFKRQDVAYFVETYSQNVIDGFQHLDPIWTSVRNGSKGDESELERVATELWELRTKVHKDIQNIYQMTMSGKESEIVLPEYPTINW